MTYIVIESIAHTYLYILLARVYIAIINTTFGLTY